MRELELQSNERAELRRESDKLRHQVKDVKRALDRYKEESARLEEEQVVLQEKVNEFEALISKRDEEIQEIGELFVISEMEGMLGDKERLIAQLEARLRVLNNAVVTPVPKVMPRGDLLDEMIG